MAILGFARLEDADLSGAKLVGADLHSANLSGATWVDGETKCDAGSEGCCVVSRECLPIP